LHGAASVKAPTRGKTGNRAIRPSRRHAGLKAWAAGGSAKPRLPSISTARSAAARSRRAAGPPRPSAARAAPPSACRPVRRARRR